jgi:hypothetical protein
MYLYSTECYSDVSNSKQINFLKTRKSEKFQTDIDVFLFTGVQKNLKFHTAYIIFKYDTTYYITLNIYYVHYII